MRLARIRPQPPLRPGSLWGDEWNCRTCGLKPYRHSTSYPHGGSFGTRAPLLGLRQPHRPADPGVVVMATGWPSFEEWQDARFPERRSFLAVRRLTHAVLRCRRAQADLTLSLRRAARMGG